MNPKTFEAIIKAARSRDEGIKRAIQRSDHQIIQMKREAEKSFGALTSSIRLAQSSVNKGLLDLQVHRQIAAFQPLTIGVSLPAWQEAYRSAIARTNSFVDDAMQVVRDEGIEELCRSISFRLEPLDQLFAENERLAVSVVRQIKSMEASLAPIAEVQDALLESARWASSLRSLDVKTGVLTNFVDDPQRGALCWNDGLSPDPNIQCSVWDAGRSSNQHPYFGSIQVHVDVKCMICCELMVSEGGELGLGASTLPTVTVKAFPMCARCQRQLKEDPGFERIFYEVLFELRAEPDGPILQVIEGDGEGTEEPRGRDLLALVEDSPDADEE